MNVTWTSQDHQTADHTAYMQTERMAAGDTAVETSTKNTAYPDIPIIMSWLVSSKWLCLPKKNTKQYTHTQTREQDCCSWERQILHDCFVRFFPKCVQHVSEWLSATAGTHIAKSGLEVGHWFKPVLRATRLAEQSSHTLPG